MFKSLDWFTVILYIILVCTGLLAINAATYSFEDESIFDFDRQSGRQLIWIGLSVLLIFALLFIDAKTYMAWAPVIYIMIMCVLVATIFLGTTRNGSRSWFQLGPIAIQPAEFGKFSTALMLAWVFNQYGFKLDNLAHYLKACVVILIPVLLILLENETGSALVYFSFILLFYREGMPGIVLWVGFCMVLIFVLGLIFGEPLILLLIPIFVAAMFAVYARDTHAAVRILAVTFVASLVYWIVRTFVPVPEEYLWLVRYRYVGLAVCGWIVLYIFVRWVKRRMSQYALILLCALGFVAFQYSTDYAFHHILQDHQRSRIEVLLGLKEDLSGAGYNVNQAKIAIGSGGWFGKGYLQGTQTKLSYVPEQETDFIFTTIGEEQGFVGTVMVLVLYAVLILRIIVIAERQRTIFAQVYAYCVACILFFHVAVNVGMVIGLMPVIGIPLPFLSFGGSSLISFTVLLFILLKLDATRVPDSRY